MRSLLLALALALSACSADLVGPDDPDFEELCVVYVEEDEPAVITRWQLEHCETVRVVVVVIG